MAHFKTGQLTISAAAQQIRAKDSNEFSQYKLKAPTSNTGTVYLGDSTVTAATGYPLLPGEELLYSLDNSAADVVHDILFSDWFAIGTVGDKIGWLALTR